MTRKSNNRGNGVKRRPISLERECSLGVISLNNLEWTDHLVKIVDYSVLGIGIESDRPIEPGIIWFKENLYGQKCGSLVWCKKNGVRYRAGIQFISLTRKQEEYFRQQVVHMRQVKRIQDPERIIAMLIEGIKKDMSGSFVHSQGWNISLGDK
jgi:hypothetical protein